MAPTVWHDVLENATTSTTYNVNNLNAVHAAGDAVPNEALKACTVARTSSLPPSLMTNNKLL
eukprot:m.616064 g.616064  ORF g.616064 m.616064 type:complete len:62 (+) comp22511_c0_seq13:2331-2516(+)